MIKIKEKRKNIKEEGIKSKGPLSSIFYLLSFDSRRGGFTLIETLIAIAILVLAIVGPLTIASNSLNSAYYARDQVTAYYLAQEGIEYARYVRDTNSLNPGTGGAWDYGLTGDSMNCSTASGPCGLDPLNIGIGGSSALSACSSSTVCPVFFDNNNGMYRQTNTANQSSSGGGLVPTNFQRFIYINKVQGNNLGIDEDQITVSVTWHTGNLRSPNNFQITEDIFNWQQ